MSFNPFKVSEEDQAKLTLLEYHKSQGHQKCSDCHDPVASNADLNHGIFLCTFCTTFHRNSGCRVQVIAYTKWTPDLVDKFIKKQGIQVSRHPLSSCFQSSFFPILNFYSLFKFEF
eukprot:Gregarina_sp_Poly_1__6598@NODE_353_length_9300_cov_96_781761_g295_i0_p8_GENE_NODE_353_length_9300_cov_96_781761_g295_i0NODE_353_length_9300_cov_96_781761_g295_i0_p8_ORF_typecomplete_len116_score8_81ArfGap/PF01412_18/1_2e10Paired_CXXCH_1/PF09699_10/0_48_NODE_353_length_9300_cov_96_781761_g295_i042264573